MTRTLLLLLALTLALASTAASQQLLRTHTGFVGNDFFGRDGEGLGDVNGDGFGDYVIGLPTFSIPGTPEVGSVLAYSGIDGSLLYQVNGVENGGYFGEVIVAAGDIDLDGATDFFVGAPGLGTQSAGFRKGTGQLISGRTGAVLRSFTGVDDGDAFGTSFANLGDITGDGVPDHVIGAHRGLRPNGPALVGAIRAYSGATGTLLYERYGNHTTNIDLGRNMVSLGDWSGDGRNDFAVSSQSFSSTFSSFTITVRSGATGAVIHTESGDPSQYRLQGTLASGGDVNGDGIQDLLMLRSYSMPVTNQRAVAVIFSGADRSILREIEGPYQVNWGYDALLPGDSDGDGLSEIVLHARNQTGTPADFYLLEVYSGRDGSHLVNVPKPEESANAWRSPYKIASAGDVNADGRIDWLISDAGYAANRDGMAVAGLANFDGTICAGVVNSTGAAAALGSQGSVNVAANDFEITVQDVPASSFGILMTSRTIGFSTNPLINGRVCIGGGPIGRSAPYSASAAGTLTIPIDLTRVALPSATSYFSAVTPGDTVNFQYWARDPFQMAASTVSSALSSQFE